MEAVYREAKEHYNFLKERPEIDWSYIEGGRSQMFSCCLIMGDLEYSQKSLDVIGPCEDSDFLSTVCDAARGGNALCVKLVVDNRNKLGSNKGSFQYNINSALRAAGLDSHEDSYDYLVSKGADPKSWHSVYWVAKKGNKSMYKKLMFEYLGFSNIPNRKKVQEFCMREDIKYDAIDIDELKKFLEND